MRNLFLFLKRHQSIIPNQQNDLFKKCSSAETSLKVSDKAFVSLRRKIDDDKVISHKLQRLSHHVFDT